MPRKMLILGALPVPCEGVWVPLGQGTWFCDQDTLIHHAIRIDVEDHEGRVSSHLLKNKLLLEGKRVRAVILEEIEGIERVNLGISRVRA